jgi:hypothetical protein
VPATQKFDAETRARAVRLYRDRLRDHGESKLAARKHVGELLDINPARENDECRSDPLTHPVTGPRPSIVVTPVPGWRTVDRRWRYATTTPSTTAPRGWRCRLPPTQQAAADDWDGHRSARRVRGTPDRTHHDTGRPSPTSSARVEDYIGPFPPCAPTRSDSRSRAPR